MTKKLLVDPKFARGTMYQKAMKEIIKEGVCPFCPGTFRWHTKPILKRLGGWLITENFSPYKDSKFHFVIVGNRHIEDFSQLKNRDLNSIFSLSRWAIRKYKIKGGGLTMRFGESEYTGATVKHLHFHLITPIRSEGKTKPVFFPIG